MKLFFFFLQRVYVTGICNGRILFRKIRCFQLGSYISRDHKWEKKLPQGRQQSKPFSLCKFTNQCVVHNLCLSFETFENLIFLKAWKLWNDGETASLADPTIFDECFEKEITNCVQIGLLCVQEIASDRPNVSTVIWMLTTENTNLPEPKQPAFIATRRVFEAESSGQSSQKVSINDVSLTTVTGR